MLRHRLRDKLLRALFFLSAFALEAAWVTVLCIGAFKIYDWAT